ncbi:MAG: sugar ABC transporter permease YjfF [Spirochaetes bacterium]|jgi:ribose/xylose/arabinose/galactoside ABC-type transport system permease subunit|nr:sugar ABC transporter permease YjfF [Spirochaetota bacterium]
MNLRLLQFKSLKSYIPLFSTIAVFFAIYAMGAVLYGLNFISLRVFLNLFLDNAFVGVIAVGMTFVIISGGIDLSVASVVAFVCILAAKLMEVYNMNPFIVMIISLGFGAVLGTTMGSIIYFFKVPDFLVTLVGMFLCRGLAYMVDVRSIPIRNETFVNLNTIAIRFPGGARLPLVAIVFIVVWFMGIYLAHFTRFGRNIYAVGGDEKSANLMGIPVARTKILVYTMSSTFAALGGLLYANYTLSGYAAAVLGLELDAIAAVVIGGTLLTGGVGFVEGTMIGVLILGLIQTLISFQGTLSSWWTKIIIGLLIFWFILLQRFLSRTPKK